MAASNEFDYTIKLSLENAKFLRCSRLEGIDSRELVIEYENIAKGAKEECVEWLDANRATLTNPTVAHNTIDGVWRSVRTSYYDDRNVIRQYFLGDLQQSAPITDGNSNWILRSGSNWRGSNNTVVLELRNIDPEYAETIANTNTETSYTNSVYLSDGTFLSGTWHNINLEYVKDENTGMVNALWTLSKQANDDVQIAYQRREDAYAAEFFKFDATETGIEALKTQYYFAPNGDWYISTDAVNYTEKNGTTATGVLPADAKNLATDVAGRSVDASITRNPQTRFYIARVNIEWTIVKTVWSNYLRNDNERVLDLYLVGLDSATLNNVTPYYYFEDDGDWYYSSDGANYTIKNGTTVSSTPLPATAFNASTEDTNADYRTVEINQEKNERNGLWVQRFRVVYHTGALVPTTPDGTVFTGSDATSYGTPLVTVTDTVVAEADTLPASAGTASYNADGTKLTEYQMLNPRFNNRTGKYSYTQREIVTWAPHANQATGAVGYIEGPSEIRRDVQTATLARGVGSGVAPLGSWAGGGRGRVRRLESSEGYGPDSTGQTCEDSKGFVPYNVQIARYSNIRTSSRMYFYVKEPIESEYPNYPTVDKNGAHIENLDSTDLTNSVPYIADVQIIDDELGAYGTAYTAAGDGYWQDDSDVFGKLVLTTYSNDITTLAYWKVNASLNAASYPDNIHYHTLEVLRTYPATGSLTITSVASDGGRAEFTTSSAHGLSVGDCVIIKNTTNYDGHYRVVQSDSSTQIELESLDGTDLSYVADETGDIIRIDASGVLAGTDIDTTFDDGLYMGHYVQTDTTFYTEAIRHRIVKMAQNVYALVVETIERTPWQWDDVNKWMLNTEGYDMRFSSPATNPATLSGDVSTNVPYIM